MNQDEEKRFGEKSKSTLGLKASHYYEHCHYDRLGKARMIHDFGAFALTWMKCGNGRRKGKLKVKVKATGLGLRLETRLKSGKGSWILLFGTPSKCFQVHSNMWKYWMDPVNEFSLDLGLDGDGKW